jgi:uncharacterized protein YybS (DUF2232 family)
MAPMPLGHASLVIGAPRVENFKLKLKIFKPAIACQSRVFRFISPKPKPKEKREEKK